MEAVNLFKNAPVQTGDAKKASEMAKGVDGADNAHWQFVAPEEGKTIEVGARVKSVLKNQAERTGEVSDYLFRLA